MADPTHTVAKHSLYLDGVLRLGTVTALAVAAILGGYLRALGMTESLWIDELHTAWCVNGGIEQVARRAMLGHQTPLFYWCQWFVVHLLGFGEWSLRLLPWVFSSATIVLAYRAAVRWSRSRLWAVVVALVIALDKDCTFYGCEARPYALLPLVALYNVESLLSLLVFTAGRNALGDAKRQHENEPRLWMLKSLIRAGMKPNALRDHYVEDRPRSPIALTWRKPIALWIATTVLLAHLHLASLWVIACQQIVLWTLIAFHSTYRSLWKPLLGAYLIAVLLCLPLIPVVGITLEHGGQFSLFIPTVGAVQLLSLLSLAWYTLPVWFVHACQRSISAFNSYTKSATDYHSERQVIFPNTLLTNVLLFLLLFPLIAGWAVTRLQWLPVFFPRYMIALQPTAWLVLAVLGAHIAQCRNGRTYCFLSLLLLACVLFYVNSSFWCRLWSGEGLRGERWREALQTLQSNYHSGEPILLRPGLIESEYLDEKFYRENSALCDYLRFPLDTFYSPWLNRELVFVIDNSLSPAVPQDAVDLARRLGRVWVIFRADEDKARRIVGVVRQRIGWDSGTATLENFGGVQLACLTSGVTATPP